MGNSLKKNFNFWGLFENSLKKLNCNIQKPNTKKTNNRKRCRLPCHICRYFRRYRFLSIQQYHTGNLSHRCSTCWNHQSCQWWSRRSCKYCPPPAWMPNHTGITCAKIGNRTPTSCIWQYIGLCMYSCFFARTKWFIWLWFWRNGGHSPFRFRRINRAIS